MKLDLDATLIFVEVVRKMSFKRAAESLGIPASTVSDKVTALERSLGVRLLVRTTRRISLTETGERYFKQADVAVIKIQEAHFEASNEQQQPSGVLRISMPPSYACFEIGQAVSEYRARFPEVKVEVHAGNELVNLLEEGYDLAIRGGHLRDSSLKAKKIGEGRTILIASPSYLKKNPSLKQPSDLSDHSCIQFHSGKKNKVETTWSLRNLRGKTVKVQPTFVALSNAFDIVAGLVRAGQGIGYVPESLIKHELSRGELVRILPEWSSEPTPINIVYLSHRIRVPKIAEMVPILYAKLKPLLDSQT